MRTVFLTLFTTLALAVLGGFVFIYSGVYDVGANTPHWPLTYWAMDIVRVHSVKAHAGGITPPQWIDEETRVVGGTAHFAAHCASCHGAPGVPRGDIANGLYPKPADLKDVAQRYTQADLFWILKNGIKMSGMPSWSDHSDDELWVTVAFLERLPGMSEADYAKLVAESMGREGPHNRGGSEEMPGNMPGMDHSSMPGMATMPGMTAPSPESHQH